MKISTKRRLGCLGALLLMVIAVILMHLVGARSLERHKAERQAKLRKGMAEDIAKIRSGNLTSVTIYSPICLEDLVAAVDCPPKVKRIWFFMCDLSDGKWWVLEQLPNLEEISFYDSGDADPLFKHIQGMESLECIEFEVTPLSDAGMKHIATLPNLKKLRIIGGPAVTNAGLAHLEGHANLETLELSNPLVTDEGLASLKEIPRLRSLVLYYEPWRGPRLTDAGLKHLKELTNLETLGVGGGWASEAAIHDLRNALPNCTINGMRKAE